MFTLQADFSLSPPTPHPLKQINRWWATTAAPLLAARRLQHATAALAEAERKLAGGPGAAELARISRSDMADLATLTSAPTPLIQLMFVLKVLWRKVRGSWGWGVWRRGGSVGSWVEA